MYSSTRFGSLALSCSALPGSAAQKYCWYCSVFLRRLDRLAEGADLLQRLVQILAGLLDPVGQQAFDVLLLVAVEGAAGVVGDGALERVEQVAVVDDVAVVLVVAVEPVDAADGLEQAVVAHLLVDVEVGGRRRVEAGQQLVDDDQQPHLARVVDEPLLDVLLELLDLVHGVSAGSLKWSASICR